MTSRNISLLIWCDGRIVSSPCGIEYHGGRPVNMALSERMSFEELQNICRRAVSTDGEVEISKIYFRLPRIVEGAIRSYSLFSVENNEHVFGILNEVVRYPQLEILELYVEYEAVVRNKTLLDQLVLGDSSGSERGSGEEEEEDFYDSNKEDVEEDLEADSQYESQLPEHVRTADLCDFDVAPEADEKIMWDPGMEFRVRMVFPNRDAVRACATTYSVGVGREFKGHRTTNSTIVLACRQNPVCKWWLRATLLQATQTWTLTKYIGPHTCNQLLPDPNHRNFGSVAIADYIKGQVKLQRDIRIDTLRAGIWQQYGVRPPYKRTWNAKEKAIADVYGGWYESFAMVHKFMNEMMHVNPGSFWDAEGAEVYTDGILQLKVVTFIRMFWTFKPTIEGFRFCKPVLFVDGTHLYGKYKMTLLIASAIDGNSHIMPLDLNSGHLGVRILPNLADLGRLRDISWGSAVLAYLYHELCLCAAASANRQNIGGAVWILQLWAYERLRPLRPRLADFDVTGGLPLGDRWGGPRQRERGTRRVPRHSVSHFRLLLDGLRYDDIVWQPYSDDVLQSIPQIYLTGRHIWRARVPMIYYHTVE
ncbi:uncharacterized protein LOC126687790 [Mercurialis annua]|uniref:uncharacterized protein LOC126687790 n=1 Tax=Mercurialis annua TaxID=3986 RepID=UPI00215E44C4|nr:uncharacterized protein LOC126687790 [Mercurialis annua]